MCKSCSAAYIGDTERLFNTRLDEHKTNVDNSPKEQYTRSKKKQSQSTINNSSLTDNNHRKLSHRLGGSNSGRYGVTQNENTAMWICKTKAAINRDEGSYKLPHMYNDVI